MAWQIIDRGLGFSPISTAVTPESITIGASTVTRYPQPLGTEVSAIDSTYGPGKFIFLTGCTNNFVGAVCTYTSFTASLGSTSGVLTGGGPIAVSMSTATGSQGGWFQIAGDAVVYKTAVKVDPALGYRVMLSATAGRVMQTSVAGRQILGCRFASTTTVTSTTSTAVVTIARPHQKSGTAV